MKRKGKPHPIPRSVLVVAWLVALVGCWFAARTFPVDPDQRARQAAWESARSDLAQARALWEANGYDAYMMAIRRPAFGGAADYYGCVGNDDSEAQCPDLAASTPVEDIFETVERALNLNCDLAEVDCVPPTIMYHATLGYPLGVDGDFFEVNALPSTP